MIGKEINFMVKSKFTMFFTLAAILGYFMIGQVGAFTHIVGGSHGWRVPDNKTYFQDWAKPRTFGVGDRLGKCCKCHVSLAIMLCIIPIIFSRL